MFLLSCLLFLEECQALLPLRSENFNILKHKNINVFNWEALLLPAMLAVTTLTPALLRTFVAVF